MASETLDLATVYADSAALQSSPSSSPESISLPNNEPPQDTCQSFWTCPTCNYNVNSVTSERCLYCSVHRDPVESEESMDVMELQDFEMDRPVSFFV